VKSKTRRVICVVRYRMAKRLRTGSGLPLLRPSFPEAEVITFVERADEPEGPAAGSTYMDDGTNTSTGDAGLRYYSGTKWLDIPYYEQGNFVPTLTIGSGSITLNATSLVTWHRVGQMVTFQGYLRVDSVSSPSGTVDIAGLPYDAHGTAPAFSLCPCASSSIIVVAQTIAGRIAKNTKLIRLIEIGTTTAPFANLSATAWSAGDIMYITGTYHTDEAV